MANPATLIALFVAIVGGGGLGALGALPWARRKAAAEVACKEAEASKLGAEALKTIISELNAALTSYRSQIAEQQRLLDQAIAESTSVENALRRARADLQALNQTIEDLHARIRQLEETLTAHGIAIPKERRRKNGGTK